MILRDMSAGAEAPGRSNQADKMEGGDQTKMGLSWHTTTGLSLWKVGSLSRGVNSA
jgi:hypothetical protein